MRLLLVGVLAYGAIIMVDFQTERFPIFNWSLFSKVPPAVREDYSVRFTEINGEVLDPPVYFASLKEQIPEASSPNAYALMRELGRQLDRGQGMKAAVTRDVFESRYLRGVQSAEYEVVFRNYDIKRRFACEQEEQPREDCFNEERVIGAFTFGS